MPSPKVFYPWKAVDGGCFFLPLLVVDAVTRKLQKSSLMFIIQGIHKISQQLKKIYYKVK